ncbi:nodulin-26-like [Vitis riparia]|uniref:nodulin-26-like n=1 Tax=Vitis riparia TaxID=96939 RepID=UPI00155AB8C0|nr:nodulin-26-like [Vitis riparia]
MAEVNILPVGCSPKPPTMSDLSPVEEEKVISISESTESTIASPPYGHKILAELVGTYVIIFAGCGCVLIDKKYRLTVTGIAVGWGMIVMVMIYTLGHVSGGHFNPAVTIAFAASRKFPWRQVPPYVLSQVAGSSLAILTLFVMLNTSIPICATVTQFSSPTTIPEAFTWEFIISFILMFAICGVATDSRAINELSGVTVGATVLVNVLLAGPITRASMNPARSIGPALVSMEFDCLWIYIVAPILGTTTATVIYSFVRLPLPEKRL